MNLILAAISAYIKPLLIGALSLLGIWFLSKHETLKAQNEILSTNIESEKNTIETQNEIIRTLNDAKTLDSSELTELMHDDKL